MPEYTVHTRTSGPPTTPAFYSSRSPIRIPTSHWRVDYSTISQPGRTNFSPPHARAHTEQARCTPTHGVHEHPRVNRTDVETLRCPSFDKFGQITQSKAAQLALLSGFHLKKFGRQAEGRGPSSRARRATRSQSLLFRASSLIPAAAAPPAATCEFMCALTLVPRFWTVAPSLSASERGAARAVWEAVVLGADEAEDADVAVSVRAWANHWYLIVWSSRP